MYKIYFAFRIEKKDVSEEMLFFIAYERETRIE